MLKVSVITNEKDLRELSKEWTDLLPKTQNNNIFLTFEWMFTWWRHYKDNKELMVLTVRDENGKLVGVGPLVLSEYRPLSILPRMKVIEFMAANWPVCSDYLDFIVLKGKEREILEAFFKYLNKHRHKWDILNLAEIPENSITLKYVADSEELAKYKSIRKAVRICPYINLPSDWDAYLNSLGKRTRWNIRYYTRRLEKNFQVKFKVWEDNKTLDNAMDAFIELNIKRWSQKERPSVFVNKKFRRFHKEIARCFFRKGWLKLHCLLVNGTIVAAIYSFKYGQKIFFYLTGFDTSWDPSKYSLGTVLLGFSIKDAICEGLQEFNFLRAPHAYVHKFTNNYRKDIQLQILNRNLRARLYHLTEIRLKSIIKAMLPKVALSVIRKFYRGS